MVAPFSAEFFASRGANFPTVTFVVFPVCAHFHFPRPLGSLRVFPVSASLVIVFCPAAGLRAGSPWHSHRYSRSGAFLTLGFAFGTFFFAQDRLFSSRLRFGFEAEEFGVVLFAEFGPWECEFDFWVKLLMHGISSFSSICKIP